MQTVADIERPWKEKLAEAERQLEATAWDWKAEKERADAAESRLAEAEGQLAASRTLTHRKLHEYESRLSAIAERVQAYKDTIDGFELPTALEEIAKLARGDQ